MAKSTESRSKIKRTKLGCQIESGLKMVLAHVKGEMSLPVRYVRRAGVRRKPEDAPGLSAGD